MAGPTIQESKDPKHLNFRTTDAGAEWISSKTEKGVTVTEVMRIALKVAALHSDEVDAFIDQMIDLRK